MQQMLNTYIQRLVQYSLASLQYMHDSQLLKTDITIKDRTIRTKHEYLHFSRVRSHDLYTGIDSAHAREPYSVRICMSRTIE